MAQINQNTDNKYSVQRQINARRQQGVQQQVRIPEYYDIPEDKLSLKESLQENPGTLGAYEFVRPLIEHPVASIATWLGAGYLLDKYTKACGGEYEKSLYKKAANFGDKIEQSKIIQSSPIQTTIKGANKVKSGFNKIVDNVAIFRAMRDTPSQPEWTTPKSEMIPQRQRIVHDFNHIADTLNLSQDGFVPLNKLGVDKKEKEMLKKVFNVSKISDIKEEKASVQIQLSRLGISQAEIDKILKETDYGVGTTKKEILKAMGKDAQWLKKVKEDSIGDYVKEVERVTNKLGNRVRIGLGEFRPKGIRLGILTKPFQRTVSCDEIYNRLHSLTKEGAKTATGRFMSKAMQMVHRGLTFGGGKLGVLIFIAPALVESAINVKKAENKQKLSTGISSFIGHISWVITFPLALKIMHTIGGAQYAGMTKDEVQKCRDIVNHFNEENKKGLYTDKATYKSELEEAKEAIKQVKAKGKWKKQNFLTKAYRGFIGKVLTPDLGKFDGRNTGNWLTSRFTKIRNLPRNLFGVPLRFILWGFISMFVLDKAIEKSIKAVFGESYNFEKEEEIKSAKKEQKKFLKEDLRKRLFEAQAAKQQGFTTINNPQAANKNIVSAHGLSVNSNTIPEIQYDRRQRDNYSYIPSSENTIKKENKAKSKQDNYTYVPSQDSTIKTDSNGNSSGIRTYIPSQRAANIQKTFDNSGLQSALDKADRAEKRALNILSGNFEGMY